MEEQVKYAVVRVCIENEVKEIEISPTTCAEDVCTEVAKLLHIGPVARHLFCLRVKNKVWLSPSARLYDLSSNTELEYRIRFKVPDHVRLKKVDIKAYDYYFHQVRKDVMENKVPDINYEKFKDEIMGLGVADMYRVMLENGIERDSIVNDYKKYIPKQLTKYHFLYIKKPIHDSLGRIKADPRLTDPWYVKGEYLKQFEEMAPNYLTEEYKALTDEDGRARIIRIRVNPFCKKMRGVYFCFEGEKEWRQICEIEDLCYISIRKDGMAEISRKNGIPLYVKFESRPLLLSFVSLLGGYYRLMSKWTFDLCRDLKTPSVERLAAERCHGPVGGEFSYAKLEEKRNNAAGCYILRESETKYNTYYLDVCSDSSSKPKTFRIDCLKEREYKVEGDEKVYPSLGRLVTMYRIPDDKNAFLLEECLPPSEYDVSPLLLCQSETAVAEDLDSENAVCSVLSGGTPRCVNKNDLQVFKNQMKEGKGGLSIVYRCLWWVSKGKKVEAAMKLLKEEHCKKYKDTFLNLADRWAFIQSNAIVKLYGVMFGSPCAVLMEYLSLGPLDAYLREHKQDIKQVDLVEAGTYLATALWHLEEQGFVHGNIRCRKLLVASHSDKSFSVRLADPGLFTYTARDIHWLPVECHSNFEYARVSVPADVWSFGTTLWEIFSYGERLPENVDIDNMKKYYLAGQKLPQPAKCPVDIYRLMLECWDLDFYRRKKPQAIMRDINQILYQVYNSRRAHTYSFPKTLKSLVNSVAGSNSSIFSRATEDTYVDTCTHSDLISLGNDTESEVPFGDLTYFSDSLILEDRQPFKSSERKLYKGDSQSPDFSTLLSSFNFSASANTSDSVTCMQSIFELDGNSNVVFQGRIGQGFYGEVYKGTLEQDDTEPQLVAIKKLKANAVGPIKDDFQREIAIMKSLKHPNIVEIRGVIEYPEMSIVMEYVQHGSLQSYLKIHKETLDERRLLRFALDVARGMEYLGHKNIVHRDLAARNVLVADENHVKISDFGLAQVMGKNQYYVMRTEREQPIKWYAPESLRDGKFSPRSDVWSYGVTLYEMFSLGEDPKLPSCEDDLNGLQQQLAALDRGTRLPCPRSCPQKIYVELMNQCWQADPHARPMFTQLCTIVEGFLL